MAVAKANDLILELAASGKLFTHIQELSVADASKVSLDVVAHHFVNMTGKLEAWIQGSNDRVNWKSLSGPADIEIDSATPPFEKTKTAKDINIDGWAFLRVEYKLDHTGASTVVLSSTLATEN